MKIKLDENIPVSLVSTLRRMGHDVVTVHDEGLGGQEDDIVWEACQQEGRFFVTQDLDFSDIDKFRPGRHWGLLLVRLRDPGRNAVANKVAEVFQLEAVDTWDGCFVVLTDRKLRVRRPPGQ